MPKMTRIAINGIGTDDARFLGFDVDLSQKDGSPPDALLVRLINGGGKTSMIKILSAAFEPDLRHLDIGPRKFKEMFGPTVGIVAIEMTVDGAQPGLFGDDQPRQVVGYAGRLRKTDGGSELERLYFHFMRTPGVGIGSLPIGREDERPTRVSAIKAILQELDAADHAMQLATFEQPGEWQAHVESTLRIDLASSIHFMMALNMQESGATTNILKRFQRDEDFLSFLLDPIIGTTPDDGLVRTVTQTLRSQSTLTEKRERRAFFAASSEKLERLAAAADGRRAAEEGLRSEIDGYRTLLGLILGRKERLGRDVADNRARLEESMGELTHERRRHETLTQERNWIDVHAHRLREVACSEAAVAAEAALDEARGRLGRTRAMLVASEIMDLSKQIEALDQQIAAKDAPLAAARAELRRVGGKARALLTKLQADVRGQQDAADNEAGRVRDEGRKLSAREAELNAIIVSNRRRDQEARAELDDHRHEFDTLVGNGHLRRGDDLREALDAARSALDVALAKGSDLATMRDASKVEVADAGSAVRTAEEEFGQARARADAVAGELDGFAETLAEVRSVGILVDRHGLSADPYMPGLTDAIRRHHDTLVGKVQALEQANGDARSVIRAIDEHGLLPPPAEIEQTLDALRQARLNAHWAPRYLVQNRWGAERIRAAIEADPARYSGIVVLGASADACRAAVATLSGTPAFRIPVCIASSTGEPEPLGGDRAVVLPSPATYDTDAAMAERAGLAERVARNEGAIGDYRNAMEALKGNEEAIRSFLQSYPEGWEASMKAALDAARADIDRKAEALAALRAEHEAAAGRLESLLEQIDTHGGATERARERHKALSDHHLVWSDRLPGIEASAEEARGAIIASESELKDLAVRKAEHEQAEAASKRLRDELADRASDIRHRLHGIQTWEERILPAPDDNLDDLEAAYAAQEKVVQQLDYGSDLSVRRQLIDEQRAKKDRDYAVSHPGFPYRDTIEAIRVHGRAMAGDIPRLEADYERAGARKGGEESGLKQATAALKEAELLHKGEMIAPDNAEELVSEHACEGAVAAREACLAVSGNRIEELEHRVAAISNAIGSATGEIGSCETALRQVATIHGLAGLDAFVADPGGADAQTSDLTGEELVRRSGISQAQGVVNRHVKTVGDEIRLYRKFLDGKAKLRACEETVAKLRDWSDVHLEESASRMLSDHRDLVVAFDDKIRQAEEEVEKCATVIRGYFDRVHERILIVERLSVMPDGLGDWSGRPFLKIRLPDDKAAYMEQVRGRIREWLDDAIAAQSQPDARSAIPGEHAPLLKRIMVHVLSGRIRFDCLRVRTNWTAEYKPVSDLQRYSGGEKLMATLLLFFLSVRIGMDTRGVPKDTGMFIMLDNPVGEMNALQLVRPALEMAEKQNIQIVGWTGLNDMNVLSLFPMLISLRRRLTASRSYVEFVERQGNQLPGVDGDRIDVGRLGLVSA